MRRALVLFAGCGGASNGLARAGLNVVGAVDWNTEALSYHQANFPDAQHYDEDVTRMFWSKLPRHDVLWASPSCVGHSQARGKEKRHHESARRTLLTIPEAVVVHRPKVVIIENVVGLLKYPRFPEFEERMKRAGYALCQLVFDASQVGVPQNRTRLFIVATRRDTMKPFVWHGPRHRTGAELTARKIIDLDAQRSWLPFHEIRSPNARAKIREGLHTFRPNLLKPDGLFLFSHYGKPNIRDIDSSFPTLTKSGNLYIVHPERGRTPITREEAIKMMGFPETYRLPQGKTAAIRLLGDAVPPPMAQEIMEQINNQELECAA